MIVLTGLFLFLGFTRSDHLAKHVKIHFKLAVGKRGRKSKKFLEEERQRQLLLQQQLLQQVHSKDEQQVDSRLLPGQELDSLEPQQDRHQLQLQHQQLYGLNEFISTRSFQTDDPSQAPKSPAQQVQLEPLGPPMPYIPTSSSSSSSSSPLSSPQQFQSPPPSYYFPQHFANFHFFS